MADEWTGRPPRPPLTKRKVGAGHGYEKQSASDTGESISLNSLTVGPSFVCFISCLFQHKIQFSSNTMKEQLKHRDTDNFCGCKLAIGLRVGFTKSCLILLV